MQQYKCSSIFHLHLQTLSDSPMFLPGDGSKYSDCDSSRTILEYGCGYLGGDLLLHEVEAHADDGHAQQQVDGQQHQLGVGLTLRHMLGHIVDIVFARNKVTEANSHEAGEAEISTVQHCPALG